MENNNNNATKMMQEFIAKFLMKCSVCWTSRYPRKYCLAQLDDNLHYICYICYREMIRGIINVPPTQRQTLRCPSCRERFNPPTAYELYLNQNREIREAIDSYLYGEIEYEEEELELEEEEPERSLNDDELFPEEEGYWGQGVDQNGNFRMQWFPRPQPPTFHPISNVREETNPNGILAYFRRMGQSANPNPNPQPLHSLNPLSPNYIRRMNEALNPQPEENQDEEENH